MNLRGCTVNWGRRRLTALALAPCSPERKRDEGRRSYYTEFALEFAYITQAVAALTKGEAEDEGGGGRERGGG